MASYRITMEEERPVGITGHLDGNDDLFNLFHSSPYNYVDRPVLGTAGGGDGTKCRPTPGNQETPCFPAAM